MELTKNTYADGHLLPASLDDQTARLPSTGLPSGAAGAESFSEQQSYSVMEKRLNLCKQTDSSSLPALEASVYRFTFSPLQTIQISMIRGGRRSCCTETQAVKFHSVKKERSAQDLQQPLRTEGDPSAFSVFSFFIRTSRGRKRNVLPPSCVLFLVSS